MHLADHYHSVVYIRSRRKIFLLTYLPWILAELAQANPVLSYFIAWLGSFLIFYLTISSHAKYLSHDLPLQFQIMRPIILIQLIFAGFMCCTSIFYFINHTGYEYLTKKTIENFLPNEQTALIAKCQRLSLLAHAALVTGIILQTKPFPNRTYRITKSHYNILFKLCTATYATAFLIRFAPQFIQFRYMLINISLSCAACFFIKGMLDRKPSFIIFGGSILGLNLMNSTLTGYKESIIVNLILIVFIAYPYYKRTVLLLILPLFYLLLYILPTFTTVVRMQSWFKRKPKELAREQAYQTFFDEANDQAIAYNNWQFLTGRLSEIGMFTAYVKQVPDEYPYYGSQILTNSLYALIPRALWKEKPNTEKLAMQRVYQSGVAQRSSVVSAKTRPVVDGYLIAGISGVFISMLLYGMLTQWLCNTAENLFGGYQLGCIILFNSIFQQLWRGNTFEFLFNNILYGYILMLLIHWIMKHTNLLTVYENTTD